MKAGYQCVDFLVQRFLTSSCEITRNNAHLPCILLKLKNEVKNRLIHATPSPEKA